MNLQRVLSLTRKAIDDYNMIEEGDRIAIGISGGKDSLTLLYALSHLPELCRELDVGYHIEKTDIYNVIFNERKESNPCSLCAKMRKGALNDAMKLKGCNKIAYAHHKDDVIDTMMLSLIYEGRFHTFAPVTYLDRTDLYVIRPLIYLSEAEVIGFVNKYDVPVVKSPCPADKHTKREYVKNIIQEINLETPGVRNRMFTAIKESNIKGWESKEQ